MSTTQKIQEKTKELKTKEDVNKFLQELGSSLLQNIPTNDKGGTSKTIEQSPISPTPRKYESVADDPFFDDVVISLYAKGLSTRAIEDHMLESYNVEISSSKVSEITNKVLPEMHDWEQRPLSRFYPFVYLDGIHFQVKDSGKPVKRCGYTVLAINEEGGKEILGIWIGESEGAKFWLQVLNDMKTRGVEDILICCVDGLKGFPDAIKTIFPDTDVQHCIVHQVRHTMKFAAHKDKKKFCADLRAVYTAVNEKIAWEALQDVKEKWPEYIDLWQRWEDKWDELSTFFAYGPQIRRLIYTTNPIENLHRQFRRRNKTKDKIYPHEEALKKLLWLTQRDISKKWILSINGWGKIMRELAINFPERVIL